MRILYIIHTDWRWIKQRSHFLSEELKKKEDVFIVTKLSLRKGNLVKRKLLYHCISLPFLPFALHRIKFMVLIDKVIYVLIFKLLKNIFSYDVVIFTHPLLFQYVRWYPKTVYDMHDDNANFYDTDSFLHKYIEKVNKEALSLSNLVVFSSRYLQKKFHSNTKHSVLIRNGHQVSMESKTDSLYMLNNPKKIFYFGTISKWFDLELLVRSLYRNNGIEYNIIGPADISKIHHPRIKWYGPLQHSDMLKLSSLADAFVMPFRITPLILGVDPVKLYEYISFCRPVIVKYYSEISQFQPFVYFYYDEKSYHLLIDRLLTNTLPPKKKNKEIHDFLINSSWGIRAEEMLTAIKKRIF